MSRDQKWEEAIAEVRLLRDIDQSLDNIRDTVVEILQMAMVSIPDKDATVIFANDVRSHIEEHIGHAIRIRRDRVAAALVTKS